MKLCSMPSEGMTPDRNEPDTFEKSDIELKIENEKISERIRPNLRHDITTTDITITTNNIIYTTEDEERPVSTYDNKSNHDRLQDPGLEESQEDEEEFQNHIIVNGVDGTTTPTPIDSLDEPLSPSQALCLMTTVPQNFAARQLGDKHTPTRNSLRHSRMIVMNRNGKIPYDQLPFVIKHYKLVKSMKITTILLGIAMCLISVWLVVWSPTMNAYDYPYWSAVPVLFSGIVGCSFLGCCPLPYPGRRMTCIYYSFKYISMSTTVLSILSTLVVMFFSSIHILYLQTATCTPNSQLDLFCNCRAANATLTIFNEKYQYQDLTCDEVQHFLSDIVVATCILNLMAAISEVSYLYAQWSTSSIYAYTKVPVINSNGVKVNGS